MAWNKIKQNLQSFLSPALLDRVEYRVIGYRYLADKAGLCYIVVDKKEVLNIGDPNSPIRWYQSEQEIRHDPGIQIPISKDEIAMIRNELGGSVPEERLAVIVRNRKVTVHAKELFAAQAALCRTDFYAAANTFLADSIEHNLASKDILLNILALVDRRIGKKRLISMEAGMKMKHPGVQYFYELRRSTL